MRWARAVLTALLAVTLASCQQPTGAPVITNGQVALSEADSAGYLDELSSQLTVGEAKALEGIMLLLGQQKKNTFAEAVRFLTEQKIVDPAWDFQADRAMTRGKVAYMIYQACNIRGGLMLTLAGPSRRYCLKELQYRGLMSPGLPYNPVTGMEYVAILARADELRQTGKVSPVMIREGGSY